VYAISYVGYCIVYRSRWFMGYSYTYLVHMRKPV